MIARRGFHLRTPWAGRALALLLVLCVARVAAAASPGSGGRVRTGTDKRAAAAAAVPASQPAAAAIAPPPPPATPSVTDGEAIRRRPGASAGAATKPSGTQPSSAQGPQPFEFRRVVTALGAVIALILGLKWAARRVFAMPGGTRASRAVQVLSRSPLAPKQQVLLLQVGRRLVVVADSGGTMSTLCQIDDPDEVTSLLAQVMAERGMASPKAFGSVFGRTRNRFDEQLGDGDGDGDEISSALDRADPVTPASGEGGGLPPVDEARSEIRGLMDKVREMSSQFRASRGDSNA